MTMEKQIKQDFIKSEQALKDIYLRHRRYIAGTYGMPLGVFIGLMLRAKSNKDYIEFITHFMANNKQTKKNELFVIQQSLKYGVQEIYKIRCAKGLNDITESESK